MAAPVAEGMSNRQIASTLGLSPRAADRHVQNILGELCLGSRAQISGHGGARKVQPLPAPPGSLGRRDGRSRRPREARSLREEQRQQPQRHLA
ncbi:LuxR C-terminal-related transcriptional regulator [Streptomyces galbus]|uniref:LuxR C-terminal-related transcriptional regulator n=1 Tax=Streptomyces gottesmaniae TaxID=3075518 RepID=UPI00099D2C3D